MSKLVTEKPLVITIPHSGERVPKETPWLEGLPEPLLMCDVDRYVDVLYQPVLDELKLRFVKTQWHRYAIDLNRTPDDVDAHSVRAHPNPGGTHSRGLHWSITTKGEKLLPNPISPELHRELITKYFEPFHAAVRKAMSDLRDRGATKIYHLDLHSMPSVGTHEHRDPGQRRADIVISDCEGASCSHEFRDLVIAAYEEAGFGVKLNWPYHGGRVTEAYGHPSRGQHSIQVELNRALYMDESSKALIKDLYPQVSAKLAGAVRKIHQWVPAL